MIIVKNCVCDGRRLRGRNIFKVEWSFKEIKGMKK